MPDGLEFPEFPQPSRPPPPPPPPPHSPQPPPPQHDANIIEQYTQMLFQIKQRLADQLRNCGGEMALLALFNAFLPPTQHMLLMKALEHEGDIIAVVVNAMRFYLAVVYGGAPIQARGRARREEGGEEVDFEKGMEIAREEVMRQAIRRAISETETKKGIENIFGQMLMAELMKSFTGNVGNVFGFGAPQQSVSQQPQSQSQQPQQKKKLSDILNIEDV